MKHINSVLKEYWQDKKFIKVNLIAWIILYIILTAANVAANGISYHGVFYEAVYYLGFIGIFFYLNFFIFAAFLEQKRKKFFFFFLFLFFFFLLISLAFAYYEYQTFFKKNGNTSLLVYLLYRSLIAFAYFLIISGTSTAYWSIRNNKKKDQKNIELQRDKNLLQSQLLQSELNFLRAQINPHFLQNCLNFIYSDTRKTNPNAADAVLLLSNIMRYSVADNSATEGMALLKDEITQVENVIQIHQLRFKEKLHIVFNKEGNFEHKQIVPMILLTLVENLIKYGDLNDSRQPARIDCRIAEKENKIYFSTTNKKVYSNKIISTGLGLKNIRDRLNLICEDNFTLEKEETEDWYIVNLLMPYKNV